MIQSVDLFSVLLLGLLGSAHCIGMCGPLVLTIPSADSKIAANLLYNLGRTTTYGLICMAMAAISSTFTLLAGKTGTDPLAILTAVQLILSFFAASFLFWLGLIRIRILAEPEWMQRAMPNRIPGFKTIQSGVVVDRSVPACYLYGVMLGFLPCGLSYSAFAIALAAAHPFEGFLVGLVFGAGTIPALFFLGTTAAGFLLRNRLLFDLLAGLVMIGMGVYLIANGLSRF